MSVPLGMILNVVLSSAVAGFAVYAETDNWQAGVTAAGAAAVQHFRKNPMSRVGRYERKNDP